MRKKISTIRKTRLGFNAIMSIVLLSILTTAIIATIVVQRELNIAVNVQGNWNFALYEDQACTIQKTTIDFGTVLRGQSYSSEEFYLKNYGDDMLYIKWSTDEPTGLYLTLFHRPATGEFTEQLEHTYMQYKSGDILIQQLRLDVDANAITGDQNFIVSFLGSDIGSD